MLTGGQWAGPCGGGGFCTQQAGARCARCAGRSAARRLAAGATGEGPRRLCGGYSAAPGRPHHRHHLVRQRMSWPLLDLLLALSVHAAGRSSTSRIARQYVSCVQENLIGSVTRSQPGQSQLQRLQLVEMMSSLKAVCSRSGAIRRGPSTFPACYSYSFCFLRCCPL